MLNKNEIWLSIIVPIYNVETYLRQCINSILAQTALSAGGGIEVVLVDDGSTDNSGGICDEYASKHKFIKVVHKANGGLPSARKAGFSAAMGQYITSVDGDDWISDDRYTKIFDIISKYHPDVINMEGFYRNYESGEQKYFTTGDVKEKLYIESELNMFYSNVFVTDRPFKRCSLSHWNIVVKRDLAVEVQNQILDSLFISEDLVYCLGCFWRARSIYSVKDSSYHYRTRNDSMSRIDGGISDSDFENLCKSIIDLAKGYLKNSRIKNAVVYALFYELLFLNYHRCAELMKNCLFPFSTVGPDSDIVICGAGNFGRAIHKMILLQNAPYRIKAVVDMNDKLSPVGDFAVKPIEHIKNIEYDYVVIANYYIEQAEAKKIRLEEMDVPPEKIAYMDYREITEDNLPDEIMIMLKNAEVDVK